MPESEVNLASIGTLLQIEQDVRQASSESAVEFIAVNDTWRLVPFRQAILWRGTSARPVLRLVSGLADVAGDSPFRQWLTEAMRRLAPALGEQKHLLVSPAMLPASLHDGWREWMPPQVLLLTLPTPVGGIAGRLWLALEAAPDEAQLGLLERLALVYGHGLWAWRQPLPLWRRAVAGIGSKRGRIALAIALLAIAALPVRLTALAPAEIIGKDAKLIGSPLDGVVANFFVTPNQPVQRGAPLFALDDTGARNRHEVASKSRAVAEADYLRATQKAFQDGASRADLSSLKAKLEEKAAEAQYTKDLFERIQVNAPEAGIVVFTDPNDWLGRPVQTGERIMALADPNKVQVAIHLPVDDAISLDPGAPVKVYLNVAPLHSIDAAVSQASYEPAVTSEGFVAYQLKADLAAGEVLPRIGLKGSAKIYGEWAPLIYHVLRKPMSVVRRTLGV